MAKKCMKCGGATKMKKGGAFIAGIPNAGQTGPNKFVTTETMKKGGTVSVTNRPVKPGCRNGMVKDANGNCVQVRKVKKGGAVKKK